MNYVIYIYDIIAISDKNLPRFTTEQETLLLNEKFIFNTKPLYEAEGIEPIHKHHDLYKNHTHHHDECGNSKNEQNPKINK